MAKPRVETIVMSWFKSSWTKLGLCGMYDGYWEGEDDDVTENEMENDNET